MKQNLKFIPKRVIFYIENLIWYKQENFSSVRYSQFLVIIKLTSSKQFVGYTEMRQVASKWYD